MFLEKILQSKAVEVAARKSQRPLAELKGNLENAPEIRSFQSSLVSNGITLIAELKKASPSKGVLCPKFEPTKLAQIYEDAGAGGISVLTEEKFFQGSLEYMKKVKAATKSVPVLCKDFIIDRYQLYEARIYGADAVLLIVAALSELELSNFIEEASGLGLASLVEVHNLRELEIALRAGAELIGINNRNLETFVVDLETTFKLLPAIPADKIVISESGIKDVADIQRLAQGRINGVLVGETIVTAPNPGETIKALLGAG